MKEKTNTSEGADGPCSRSFRAGDTVHHKPSDEHWWLAVDEENGKVQPCGWPECMAEALDCELITASTDDERLSLLKEWAMEGKGCDRDSRTRAARRQLASENTQPQPTPLRSEL